MSDQWGNRDKRPPELDELLDKGIKKLGEILRGGKGGSGGSGSNGDGSNNNPPKPSSFPLVLILLVGLSIFFMLIL